jgi:hypothetical protein
MRGVVPSSTAALIAVLSMLTGCSGGSAQSGAEPPVAKVVEKDFKIDAPASIPAGVVDLAVNNRGPVSHELIVVRGRTAGLPLRDDNVTVDEDAMEERTAGALEPQPAGLHNLQVTLRPGRYVFICNMAGHYRGGMHTELQVR